MSGHPQFPGDPTLYDAAAETGPIYLLAGAAGLVLLALLVRRGSFRSSTKLVFYAVPALAALLGGVLTGAGWWVVGSRHVGEWRPIREAIRSESERIERQLGARRRLSDDELETLETRLEGEGGRFLLSGGAELIRLHAFYEFPYVGLDFGHGGVAAFDPRTMLCTYSD